MALNIIQNWLDYVPQLNGELTSVFDEEAKRRVEKDMFYKMFDVVSDSNFAYSYANIPTFGNVEELSQGQDFPTYDVGEGFKKVYSQKNYGAGFLISKEMRLFIMDKRPQILKLPKNLARRGFDMIDQSAADVLNNGWVATYTNVYGTVVDNTTADGAVLFSSAHTIVSGGQSFGNLIWSSGTNLVGTPNPPFSRAAVVAAKKLSKKMLDSAGNLTPIDLNILIVGPDLEDEAIRVIKSQYINGSANNDTNENLTNIEIRVWDRITGNKWFMAEKESLGEVFRAGFAQYPILSAPQTFPTNTNREYLMDYFMYLALGYAGFIYGSNGTSV